MRKIFSVFLGLVLMFCFSGCKPNVKSITPKIKGISFNADFNIDNNSFNAKITSFKNGDMAVETVIPNKPDRLLFNFSGNDFKAEYLGLTYNGNVNSLPESAVCYIVYNIFKDAQGKGVCESHNNYYIENITDKLDYKLYLGGTGLPLSFEEQKIGLKGTFSNVTVL